MTQIRFPTLPHPDFAGKTRAGDLGDAMAEVDHNVGVVLDAIDRLKLSANTIVLWCTDNGAEQRRPWRGSSGPWAGFYNTVMEGGIRTPCIIRWPGRIPAGRVSSEIVHQVDIFPTLAAAIGADIVPKDRATSRMRIPGPSPRSTGSWRTSWQPPSAIRTCRPGLPIPTRHPTGTEQRRSTLAVDRPRRRWLAAGRGTAHDLDDERGRRLEREAVGDFGRDRLARARIDARIHTANAQRMAVPLRPGGADLCRVADHDGVARFRTVEREQLSNTMRVRGWVVLLTVAAAWSPGA